MKLERGSVVAAELDATVGREQRGIRRVLGDLPPWELAAIDEGLRLFLGLGGRPGGEAG